MGSNPQSQIADLAEIPKVTPRNLPPQSRQAPWAPSLISLSRKLHEKSDKKPSSLTPGRRYIAKKDPRYCLGENKTQSFKNGAKSSPKVLSCSFFLTHHYHYYIIPKQKLRKLCRKRTKRLMSSTSLYIL